MFLFSCQNTENKEEESQKNPKKDTATTPIDQVQESPTLQSILDERKANFNQKASEEKKRIYGEGIAAIENSSIFEEAKNVGDEAPNFKLPNAIGEKIKLSKLLKDGPVVLLWYRGGWCPYCNMTLSYYQDMLPVIQASGGQLVAISPELPDSSMSTQEKNNLTFEILSDVGNKTAKDYGVVFELTPEVAEKYQSGFNLHKYNGDESNTLPLAATYVINTDGTITYAFLDADYRNRAEPNDVIKALENLK